MATRQAKKAFYLRQEKISREGNGRKPRATHENEESYKGHVEMIEKNAKDVDKKRKSY